MNTDYHDHRDGAFSRAALRSGATKKAKRRSSKKARAAAKKESSK